MPSLSQTHLVIGIMKTMHVVKATNNKPHSSFWPVQHPTQVMTTAMSTQLEQLWCNSELLKMRCCKKSKLLWLYLQNPCPSLKSTLAQASVSASKQGAPKVSFLTTLIPFQIDYTTSSQAMMHLEMSSLSHWKLQVKMHMPIQVNKLDLFHSWEGKWKHERNHTEFGSFWHSQWLNTNYSSLLNPQYLCTKGNIKLGKCNAMKRPAQWKASTVKRLMQWKGLCSKKASAAKTPVQRRGQHSEEASAVEE